MDSDTGKDYVEVQIGKGDLDTLRSAYGAPARHGSS